MSAGFQLLSVIAVLLLATPGAGAVLASPPRSKVTKLDSIDLGQNATQVLGQGEVYYSIQGQQEISVIAVNLTSASVVYIAELPVRRDKVGLDPFSLMATDSGFLWVSWWKSGPLGLETRGAVVIDPKGGMTNASHMGKWKANPANPENHCYRTMGDSITYLEGPDPVMERNLKTGAVTSLVPSNLNVSTCQFSDTNNQSGTKVVCKLHPHGNHTAARYLEYDYATSSVVWELDVAMDTYSGQDSRYIFARNTSANRFSYYTWMSGFDKVTMQQAFQYPLQMTSPLDHHFPPVFKDDLIAVVSCGQWCAEQFRLAVYNVSTAVAVQYFDLHASLQTSRLNAVALESQFVSWYGDFEVLPYPGVTRLLHISSAGKPNEIHALGDSGMILGLFSNKIQVRSAEDGSVVFEQAVAKWEAPIGSDGRREFAVLTATRRFAVANGNKVDIFSY